MNIQLKNISFFFLALIFAACSTQHSADIAIRGAHIVDVEADEIIKNKTIAITDGEIKGVYDANENIEAENEINAEGKYVIPGLWDMHVHFRGGSKLINENKDLLNLFIANGVTTVRDAGGDLTASVLDWKTQIGNGELLGPQIFTSGPKLDGPDARWAGSIEISSPQEVPAAFDSLESLNVDYVKLYDSTISAEVYLAAIKEAEKRGLPVTGHMPFTVDFNNAVAAGLDATEHMYYVLKGSSTREDEITAAVKNGDYGFWGALSEVVATYDQERADKTYEQMAEVGTAVVPTLHIGGTLANLKTADHSADEYLNYIGPGIQETYQGRLQSAKRSSEAGQKRREALRQQFVRMIPDLHQAGVAILAGSDSGPFNSFVYPGLSLHKELQELVEAGLTPAEALVTSVINGPEFFGVADRYGKIKEGFVADLVILNTNPLQKIENTKDIHGVIAGGDSLITKPQLQELLSRTSDQ
jgi:imidazolonepropionase-like amidohydrolase